MTAAVGYCGAILIALAAAHVAPNSFGASVCVAAILGFWRLLESLKRGKTCK